MRKLFTPVLTLIAAAAFGLSAHAQQLTVTNFTGQMVPQYMMTATTGGTSGDSTRLPVIFRATVTGLLPSTNYRYFVQGATIRDMGQAKSGAGLPMFINYGGTTTVIQLASLGNPAASGSFMSTLAGDYTAWFAFVPSTNNRFSVDSIIRPSITLKAQSGSDTTTKRYALDQTIRVLSLGQSAGSSGATAIWGNSNATAKNIIALWDNTDASGRPLSTAITEDIGINIARQPTWYHTNVSRHNGAWGTAIPNALPGGVQLIAQYDQAGLVVGDNANANGMWGTANTVNPAGGNASPIVITSTVAPLDVYTAVKPKAQMPIRVWADAERQELQIQARDASSLRICSLTGQTIARVSVARGQQAAVSTNGWAKGLYILVDERNGSTYRAVVR